MSDERFQALQGMIARQDAGSSLDFLIDTFRAEKNYPAVLQTRLMKSRLNLGLPLIQTEDVGTIPEEQRRQYEKDFIEAAREAGQSFLADGNIAHAWPYFRAIGEPAPVVAAIDKVEPGEGIDDIIGIAFQEGVHPVKGLELILAQYGMCRAITAFGMQGAGSGRQQCMQLLTRSLHGEVLERIRNVVIDQEGSAPETQSLIELMAGREWLFGEYSYYVDTSHLGSVLQFAPDLEDEASLRLIHELCAYGMRLSTQFQQRGYPPFEDPYVDFGKLVEAQLGINPDEAIAHFRRKADESDPEEVGTAPAQALVRLLVRMKRFDEALDAALQYLGDVPPSQLTCPSAMQICQLAGDYGRLMELAKEKGDLLSYAAAGLSGLRS